MQLDELNSKLPEHLRVKLEELEAAELLFGERRMRFSLSEPRLGDDGQVIGHCLRIIVDERLAFSFYKTADGWDYDGWEVGDHSADWNEDNLP